MRVVLWRRIGGAAAVRPLVGKEFVGDAQFDVGSLTGEHEHRFVLRLPAEFGDGAVIAAGIEPAGNASCVFDRLQIGQVIFQNIV